YRLAAALWDFDDENDRSTSGVYRLCRSSGQSACLATRRAAGRGVHNENEGGELSRASFTLWVRFFAGAALRRSRRPSSPAGCPSQAARRRHGAAALARRTGCHTAQPKLLRTVPTP